jgi:hypothetical protein
MRIHASRTNRQILVRQGIKHKSERLKAITGAQIKGRFDKLTLSMPIKISYLLDEESKLKAAQILNEEISSVGNHAISRCVFFGGQRSRYETWALTIGPKFGSIISTMVVRKHTKLELIELIYIATSSEFKGHGFGSLFLKLMKERWRSEGYAYVLTFADLSAKGFFGSLQFTEGVPFPRDLYECWVDKYSESVLMSLNLCHSNHLGTCFRERITIQVLVCIDNVDRGAKKVWVDGHVIGRSGRIVFVQYVYMLKQYVEVLSCDSSRVVETEVLPPNLK